MKHAFSSSRRNRRSSFQESNELQEKPFFEAKESNAKSNDAFFQAKLALGQPGDPYEKEADQMADQVVNNTNTSSQLQRKEGESIQRVSLATPKDEERFSTADARIERDKEVQTKSMEEEEMVQTQAEEEEIQAQMEEEEVQTQSMEEEELQTKSEAPVGQPNLKKVKNQLGQHAGGGKPLPKKIRSEMEAAFHTDFSQVRIHADENAREMNHDLHAQAFTHQKNIYFNSGKYYPETSKGKHLLAHELTHVIQQTGMIQKQDMDAGVPTTEIRDAGLPGGVPNEPSMETQEPVESHEESQTTQSPFEQIALPGYLQLGSTCGASSIINALMIYDLQQSGSGQPHQAVINAINIILIYLRNHRQRVVNSWNSQEHDGELLVEDATQKLSTLRSRLQEPHSSIRQVDFHILGGALYILYGDDTSGLSVSEISQIHELLGLKTGVEENIQNYQDIFNNSVVSNLQPGQIAQIGWMVLTGERSGDNLLLGPHAFLIGRFLNGNWYLLDQGSGHQFMTDSLFELEMAVVSASQRRSYWLYTTQSPVLMVSTWTGAKLLGEAGGLENELQNLLPAGSYLAEVDAGLFTWGDPIYSRDFVERFYDLSLAWSAAHGVTNGGAVIIEEPTGVYAVYKTNLVSDANATVNTIDSSEGGILTSRSFVSARLYLNSGRNTKDIRVY